MTTKLCEFKFCNKPFEAKTKRAKYCCDGHRRAAYEHKESRWIKRREKHHASESSPPGYRRFDGRDAGPWQDGTLPVFVSPDGLRRQALRSVYRLWYQDGVRRLPPLYAALLHRPFIDCLAPAIRQGLKGRKKVRWKVVVELGRATHELEKKLAIYTERDRSRMLELQEETEKMAETADKLDEAFRLSQKEWLQLKAQMVTQARSILDLSPATSRFAGLRDAAESILALNDEA
jgi:hypothetical protein